MGNRRIWVVLPLLAVLLTACGQHNGQQRGRGDQALAVQVVRPVSETVPLTVTAAGTMSSPHSVTITARITGRLDKVWVNSGQTVRKGQVLFTLDAAPYEAALAEAEAKLRGDEAQARYSAGQVESLKPLVAKDYVTRQTYEQAVATAQANRAQVTQDRAALETARLNLGYTTLHAPIAGRLGVISLQPGNVVQADSTSLVTLKQMSPLLVNFSLPQAMLQQVLTLTGSGLNGEIEVMHEDLGTVLAKGHLKAVDNGVSASTGTISLQGEVDNAGHALWPGQFVSVRLRLGALTDALVLPAGAVQPGQDGTFVYVVQDGKAVVRKVTVRLTTATKAVIGQGLGASDTVIYPLPARIRPNAPVQLLEAGGPTPAAAGKKAP
jgi:multidrug efflux system membrane fusion protein